MFRFWQRIRVGILCIVFVGLGIYLFSSTPWKRFLGLKPDYAPVLAEGRPIARAVYRYRAENGLWPQYLEDLVPGDLATKPSERWVFTRDARGLSLVRETTTHNYVGYDFDAANPQWVVFGVDENRALESWKSEPVVHLAGAEREKQIAAELALLEMRIGREKMVIDHRRDKAALLKAIGKTAEARTVIEEAKRDMPDDFWPRMAEAALEPTPEAIEKFAEWVKAHPSLTHDYDLAVLYRLSKDDPKMTTAIEAAIAQPPELGPDDARVLPAYFWDMARMTRADDALQVKICDAWERGQAKRPDAEMSFFALRAAAHLHLKNFAAAQADMEKALASKTPLWAEHLDELQKAITRHDAAFPYDPGDKPAMYDIFALPE